MAPRGSSRGQTTQPGRALRGAGNSSGRTTRGGIQKRRGGGPGRTDSDGDLDMDGNRRAGSKPPTESSQASRGSRGSRPTNTRGASRAAQAIARHLNGDAASLSSRTTGSDRRTTRESSLAWLRVRGLKESKAASNEGGGLKDLLGFLERKASHFDSNSRNVTIRKVCIIIERVKGTTYRGRWSHSFDNARALAKRGTKRTIQAAYAFPAASSC
jgi:nuclear RNA export factor